MQRHRQPGTGARMLALRLGQGVTLGSFSLAATPISEGAAPLIAAVLSGGGDVTLPDGAEPPATAPAAEAVGCDAVGIWNVPHARARARERDSENSGCDAAGAGPSRSAVAGAARCGAEEHGSFATITRARAPARGELQKFGFYNGQKTAQSEPPPGALPPPVACPVCGGRDWRWRANVRRRATGWRCWACQAQQGEVRT